METCYNCDKELVLAPKPSGAGAGNGRMVWVHTFDGQEFCAPFSHLIAVPMSVLKDIKEV